jgi:uncharacterized protein (TIGR02118 family)
MNKQPEKETAQESGRRDMLAGAGKFMIFGAASVVLSACGSADTPVDAPADSPDAEDVIGARCITVLYPNGDDVTFDYDYYRDKHLTLIMDLYGESIRRFELRKGLPGPDGSKPMYVATISIWIADIDAFAAAGELHTQTLIDDVPNFTNTTPVFQTEELYGLGES